MNNMDMEELATPQERNKFINDMYRNINNHTFSLFSLRIDNLLDGTYYVHGGGNSLKVDDSFVVEIMDIVENAYPRKVV